MNAVILVIHAQCDLVKVMWSSMVATVSLYCSLGKTLT